MALDLSHDLRRLRLSLSEEEFAAVRPVHVDITDFEALELTCDEHAITNVIHLAALQVPFCRADPLLGAQVNVVGTMNVLEAVARRQARTAPLVYASSIAVYTDSAEIDTKDLTTGDRAPDTLYGVYKRANEGAAEVYWRDRGLASVGLRPHTVYGLGRDQGVTSAPTFAMLAAACGRRFRIPYGGRLRSSTPPT